MSDSYRAALNDYVEKAKAAGMSYNEVREGLIGGGWDAAMVDEMLPEAFGEPAVSAAAPPGAPPPAESAAPPAYSAPAQQPAAPPVAPVTAPPAYAPLAQQPAAPPVAPMAAPPAYGAPPAAAGWGADNNSGSLGPPPPEVEAMGWSWGGFGLNWIWGIGNKVWIALLCLIPCVNLIVAIYLGISGHKLAWQNRRFDSLQQFQETMKAWNLWGLIMFLFGIASNILYGIISAAANR